MVTIVIPLHSGGGKLRDDTELRFALRSIERHFREDFRIVIAGRRVPAWVRNVEHLPVSGLKEALRAAGDLYPAGFFWIYDDCCLLRDHTAAMLRVTPACREWKKALTKWAAQLERVKVALEAAGVTPWDYSRPHGPYWFTGPMIVEAFRSWPKMTGKLPIESWMLSRVDWPRRFAAHHQYYGPFTGPPAAAKWLLNWNDAGFTPELREWLARRFPEPSRFESPAAPADPMPAKQSGAAFVLSNGRRVAFIHIPKTGGQSIHRAFGLRLQLHQSVRRKSRARQIDAADYAFAFVRHPLDRAVSLWAWFAGLHRRPGAHRAEHSRVNAWARHATADEFWQRVLDEQLELASNQLRPHTWFLTRGGELHPKIRIYRFEHFEDSFRTLCAALKCELPLPPRINASAHRHWSQELAPATSVRLRLHFARDFELLGYE